MRTALVQFAMFLTIITGVSVLVAESRRHRPRHFDMPLFISTVLMAYNFCIDYVVRFFCAEGARWNRHFQLVYRARNGLPDTEIPLPKFLPLLSVFLAIFQWIPGTAVQYYDNNPGGRLICYIALVVFVLGSYLVKIVEYFIVFPGVYIRCGEAVHVYDRQSYQRFRDGVRLHCNQLHCAHHQVIQLDVLNPGGPQGGVAGQQVGGGGGAGQQGGGGGGAGQQGGGGGGAGQQGGGGGGAGQQGGGGGGAGQQGAGGGGAGQGAGGGGAGQHGAGAGAGPRRYLMFSPFLFIIITLILSKVFRWVI